MGFYSIVIIIVFLYIVIEFFSKKDEEDNELNYSRRLSSADETQNRAEENRTTEDDLPPYTPPSPKTKAAMADLPPSYDETFDISEVRVPNASYMVNNDGSNVNINTNTNNNINMPPPCAVNPYYMNNNVNTPYGYPHYNNVPQIVIDPMNNRTTTVV